MVFGRSKDSVFLNVCFYCNEMVKLIQASNQYANRQTFPLYTIFLNLCFKCSGDRDFTEVEWISICSSKVLLLLSLHLESRHYCSNFTTCTKHITSTMPPVSGLFVYLLYSMAAKCLYNPTFNRLSKSKYCRLLCLKLLSIYWAIYNLWTTIFECLF